MVVLRIEAEIRPDNTVTLKLPPDVPPGRVTITVERDDDGGTPLTHHEKAVMRERARYLELHPGLVGKYMDQYVAISGGKLIDSDRNRVAIWRRIQRNYPGKPVYVTCVRREAVPLLRSVSTRLVRGT